MPNGRRHYDMTNDQPVQTSCTHSRDGTNATASFTIEHIAEYAKLAPDCMGAWLVWWRQNFPGLDNNAIDADGLPMRNWWPYLYY